MLDSTAWFPTAYLASEWLIRLAMTPIVIRRRQPSNALAWLVCISFLPWIGLVLYALIGQRRLGNRRLRQHIEARRRIEATVQLASMNLWIAHPAVAPEQDDLVLLCERLTGLPIISGNSVEFHTRAADVIDSIIADLDRASHHAHLLFYIFKHDETGRRVAAALARAARRGVECRLLIDGVGSKNALRGLSREMRRAGVEVCEALPAGIFRRRLRRLDLRNHRKIVVIDGEIGYTGSQNIINADYGRRGIGAWRDIMMRITGPAVSGLQIVFAEDWCNETGHILKLERYFPVTAASADAGGIPIQIVPSGPNDSSQIFRDVAIAAIHEAQRRVVLTTPYFLPDESLMHALKLAVLRGVRVDLVVPKKCDQRIVGAAMEAQFGPLLEAGVIVHHHFDGLLHAKTLSVDEAFGLVGSGNLDSRSFSLNFELSVLLYGEPITRRLLAEQERYIENAAPLRGPDWTGRTGIRTLIRNLASLFSPLL